MKRKRKGKGKGIKENTLIFDFTETEYMYKVISMYVWVNFILHAFRRV